MTPAERPSSIEGNRMWLPRADIDRMVKCGFIVVRETEPPTVDLTYSGMRKLAAVAWFTDLPGDERIA